MSAAALRLDVVVTLALLFAPKLQANSLTAPLQRQTVKLGENIELLELEPDLFVVHQVAKPYQANGLMVVSGDDYILADSKNRDEDAELLYQWMQQRTKTPRITIINSHSHPDATGSNAFYKKKGARILASTLTQQILLEKGLQEQFPTETFALDNPPTLSIGSDTFQILFPGHSHASDDIVIYLPKRKLLFASCMAKSGNDLGYLADANLETWRLAMDKIKDLTVTTVIPGHGLDFSPAIIFNTIRLLDDAITQKQSRVKGDKNLIKL